MTDQEKREQGVGLTEFISRLVHEAAPDVLNALEEHSPEDFEGLDEEDVGFFLAHTLGVLREKRPVETATTMLTPYGKAVLCLLACVPHPEKKTSQRQQLNLETVLGQHRSLGWDENRLNELEARLKAFYSASEGLLPLLIEGEIANLRELGRHALLEGMEPARA